MDECVSDHATSCGNGPGRDSGEGMGGLEMTVGVECDASIRMGVSESMVDIEASGMTMATSERLLKMRLTAMIPAAPVSALKSAPTYPGVALARALKSNVPSSRNLEDRTRRIPHRCDQFLEAS
jgi:hypothetical protein